MFLLRSAFWLTLAFVVIRPDVDMADSAARLSSDAMLAGSQFVAAQIESIDCTELHCLGGKAMASAALNSLPPVGTPMHAAPMDSPVPYPRPRPDRAG
jgi:hypothetical protein